MFAVLQGFSKGLFIHEASNESKGGITAFSYSVLPSHVWYKLPGFGSISIWCHSGHPMPSTNGYTWERSLRHRAQWLRGRASDSRLREPGFKPCDTVLKPWAGFFTLHCSSSLSCIKEFLAMDSGGCVYVCMSSLHALIVAYGWVLPREASMVSSALNGPEDWTCAT